MHCIETLYLHIKKHTSTHNENVRIKIKKTYHLSDTCTAETQSSCCKQSKGSGEGTASIYSTNTSRSVETPLVKRCSLSLLRKSSSLITKSNWILSLSDLSTFSVSNGTYYSQTYTSKILFQRNQHPTNQKSIHLITRSVQLL